LILSNADLVTVADEAAARARSVLGDHSLPTKVIGPLKNLVFRATGSKPAKFLRFLILVRFLR
jgi:hypothetical protein